MVGGLDTSCEKVRMRYTGAVETALRTAVFEAAMSFCKVHHLSAGRGGA